ncbi:MULTISPECIES: pitrilysin family protein [unclassified Crossiella]|uniref:M16 family metallopeptidase n=1 Tax=unclassified Crossiella TaxID=2620835 RepID=UPI001FFF529E|nr:MULTISPECIES: insulinase family protein [unclassified Crossiella]MCK2241644.1 insulinase family protein [Crossiella sp. S99.2]MCK2255484.1 insulinase family protein [Crossiella sp. S99.1]
MNGLSTSDEVRLPNGLRLLTIPERRIPVAEVRLVIPFARVGPEAASLDLLAACLLTGARDRDRRAFAEAVADCGGRLDVLVGPEELTLAGSVLCAGLPQLLRLLHGVLVAPGYTAAELNHAWAKAANTVPGPRTQAQRALLSQRFLNHPLATDPADARPPATTPEDLHRVHQAVLTPHEAVLVLAGSIGPAEIALATELFGCWQGPLTRYSVPPLRYRESTEITGDAETGLILLAAPAVDSADPRCAALDVANQVFGGLTSSRLMRRLRAELALVYSATSTFQVSRGGSWLLLDTTGAPASVPRIVTEIQALLTGFTPTPDEFEQARQYAIGMTRLGVASLADLATAAAGYAAYGLSPRWLLTYPEQLRALTLAEVAAAAEEFLRPHCFTGVTA